MVATFDIHKSGAVTSCATEPVGEEEASFVASSLTVLDLELVGADIYRGGSPSQRYARGIYGGQVVTQALRSAMYTVEPRFRTQPYHGYFTRRGNTKKPIYLRLERTRDVRSPRVSSRAGRRARFDVVRRDKAVARGASECKTALDLPAHI